MFDIDPATGQLTPVGTPVNTGASSGIGIVVNTAGTLVYVTNNGAADKSHQTSVSAFTVSFAGTLTPVSGSPFPEVAWAVQSPALLHNDQLLVVDDKQHFGSDYLGVSSVNSTTGALTPVTNSPFATSAQSQSASADPSGNWYYQADSNAAQLTGYSILYSTDAPVVLSGMPVAANTTKSAFLNGIAFSPNGAYVYLGLFDSNQLSGFSLSSSGAATLLPGSPFTIDGLSAITGLAVSRNGSQLIIADGVSHALYPYSVSSAGIPSQTSGGGTFADLGYVTGLVLAE